MIRVFVEYKIKQEKRQEYLGLIAQMKRELAKQGARHFELYEGTDQPDLFVEMFDVDTEAAYRQIKQSREAHPVLDHCVEGGKNKINIWAFRQIKLEDN
ncbi:MAG: MFS transporter [Bacillaceae bacterium]|nr:MFS transporter [Bacillaceae bacterium]